MPEAMLRGARVQYRSYGEDKPGTPVLLAHCSLAHSGLWKPIAEALSVDRPVIAPDMPAHGRSDPPPAGESLQLFAAEMLAMMAESFGRPAHLVGLSLGGAAQSRAAWKRPELAASLTMIEPVLFHFQLPAIGYINAVNTTAKTTNSPNLTLSATRPDTIVAAVPANADWNKKSTVGTNPASVTISAVTVGSKNKPPK